jgi:class 3 adenylate cyclase
MIARARKNLKNGAAYGLILTLAVTVLARFGFLDAPEHFTYDTRARYCQFFTAKPTDKLVHLDIDDAALDSIGKWAWPGTRWAEIVDEIRLAQPKALAFDILFTDPAPLRPILEDGKIEEVDDDKAFAESLHRLGRALIPLELQPEPPHPATPVEQKLHEALMANLELSETEAPEVLHRLGVDEKEIKHAVDPSFLNMFLGIRRNVMRERLMDELRKKGLTREELRNRLLPHTDQKVQTAATRLLDDEYPQVVSELALVRFSAPVPANVPPMLHADLAMTPVAVFSQAAGATGLVDNPKNASGVVRSVPLIMEHDGRIYPQIGLELAAMMLDADISQFQFSNSQITIPRPNGKPVIVPVYAPYSDTLKSPVPMMFDIPWFGPANDWEHMYDKIGQGHLSMNVVWDACLTTQRISRNNLNADNAVAYILDGDPNNQNDPRLGIDPDRARKYAAHLPRPLDTESRKQIVQFTLGALKESGWIDAFSQIKDPSSEEKKHLGELLSIRHDLEILLKEADPLQAQLAAQRTFLRKRLHDKAILIGWTATAQTFDEVATSIHAKCPGVVVHGVIFNGIMTGEMWRRAPAWLDSGIILLMGLVTTLLATQLSPARALLAAMTLAAIYAGINGILIFDWGNYIVTLAGPLLVIAVVWAGCTLARLLIESWERARITRRFQSYVDPALVQYVVDHPELVRLEGEVREMTVCFTDLIGFTSLTERLREKAVKILGRYIARMVPPIRNHRGLVHRFMGDGIMFSYGAPVPNPDMAVDAVTTIMEMHQELIKFNDELVAEGYPRLSIRAGVNTGMAVVGDSGADDAAEYACLGDTTNLAARLESANGLLGTCTLISSRTAELLKGQFLLRPIARLVVKGRIKVVMALEPLAHIEQATEEQIRLADLTANVFDAYLAGDFKQCMAAADALEEVFGPSRLVEIYRDACRTHLATPPKQFDGSVTLGEK